MSVVTATAQHLLQYGEWEVGISESVAAAAGALGLCKVLCWLPLIATRNTPLLPCTARQFPPATGRQSMVTVHPHWCHIASTVAYLGSLAYCATLGGAFDRDH